MTAINIISGLCFISLVWLFYMAFTAKELPNVIPENNTVKVEDIPIGHRIYDLFPEWGKEFENDPTIAEISATCDLYVASKNLLDGNENDLAMLISLRDAVDRFEKYAL